MKKILVLNTTYENGGAASIARSVYFEIAKASKDDVFFAFGRGKQSDDKQIFYFGNKLETLFHVFLVRFFGLEGFGSFFVTRKLIKFIEEKKIEVVHLHNLHGYYLNFFYLLKYLNKNNIKVVWTIHDEWPFTWLPAHSMGCAHCLGESGKCTNTYKYPRNFFPIFRSLMINKKRELLNYHNIIYVSPAFWLFDKLKEFNNDIHAELIPHGIDLKTFKKMEKVSLREKYNLLKEKKLVLFSAADLKNKNKGIGCVLALAEILPEEYQLLSIGEGLSPTKNIISFGKIFDKKVLAEIYALSDLYLLSSLAESVSLAMLESLACAVPVIAFDMPATKFLENKKCGLIIKNKDSKSILQAIEKIFSNPADYEQMSLNARKFAEEKSDYNLMINKYLQLF